MTTQSPEYMRFSVFQRIEHWVMTLSFTILAVTGLPQRYPLTFLGDALIRAFGGLEYMRLVHRVAAVVLILVFFIHLCELAYKFLVLRLPPSILPGPRDVLDLFGTMAYNLGLRQEKPALPRYNFAEKMEYWAVMWGTVLMGVTGFMLWNPILTARILPGQVIPAAKAAHSAEAVLAVLAILVWHVYWAHLKSFNWSIFTGKLSHELMVEEHAAELEELKTAKPRAIPPEILRRRTAVFFPAATISMIGVFIGLYFFTSYEETAITTVPPAETAQPVVFATSTPTRARAISLATATTTPTTVVSGTVAAAGAMTVPKVSRPIQGRENCLQCHTLNGPMPFPASHTNYPVKVCLVCHSTEAPHPPPQPVLHSIQGRENCALCHTGDLLPQSHRAVELTASECMLCHAPAGPGPTAAPTVTATMSTPAVITGTISISSTSTVIPTIAPTETSSGIVTATSATKITFAQIQPILQQNCGACHGTTAGLNVTDYAALSKGGKSGPAFQPGDPEHSLIIQVMRRGHPKVLTGSDLQLLVDWIATGASGG